MPPAATRFACGRARNLFGPNRPSCASRDRARPRDVASPPWWRCKGYRRARSSWVPVPRSAARAGSARHRILAEGNADCQWCTVGTGVLRARGCDDGASVARHTLRCRHPALPAASARQRQGFSKQQLELVPAPFRLRVKDRCLRRAFDLKPVEPVTPPFCDLSGWNFTWGARDTSGATYHSGPSSS